MSYKVSIQVTAPIRVMCDGTEQHPIGVRLDCGDGMVVYLSRDQATDLAGQLKKLVDALAEYEAEYERVER